MPIKGLLFTTRLHTNASRNQAQAGVCPFWFMCIDVCPQSGHIQLDCHDHEPLCHKWA